MGRDDEIMAAWLLKGGKMLGKTCKTCGCPLFEYKGEVSCVVCAAEKEEGGAGKGEAAPADPGAAGAPGAPGTPAAGKAAAPAVKKAVPGAAPVAHSTLAAALEGSIIALCARAEAEPDPEKATLYMKAIRKGVEALRMLDQG